MQHFAMSSILTWRNVSRFFSQVNGNKLLTEIFYFLPKKGEYLNDFVWKMLSLLWIVEVNWIVKNQKELNEKLSKGETWKQITIFTKHKCLFSEIMNDKIFNCSLNFVKLNTFFFVQSNIWHTIHALPAKF